MREVSNVNIYEWPYGRQQGRQNKHIMFCQSTLPKREKPRQQLLPASCRPPARVNKMLPQQEIQGTKKVHVKNVKGIILAFYYGRSFYAAISSLIFRGWLAQAKRMRHLNVLQVRYLQSLDRWKQRPSTIRPEHDFAPREISRQVPLFVRKMTQLGPCNPMHDRKGRGKYKGI